MALTDTSTRFLFYAKSIGVTFSETLTIGKLDLLADPCLLKKLIRKYNLPTTDFGIIENNKFTSESLFRTLGATEIESLDYSAYEGASIIHDMNKPVSDDLKNKFSVVIDGGSLEHIFNFPAAIQNCMQMVKENGHFIGFAPLNNLMGHGFYQFSPELFYRIFTHENGYTINHLFIVAANFFTDTNEWYSVKDPDDIKERVLLTNSKPTYILLLAQKINTNNPFTLFPIQGDYLTAWNTKKPELTGGSNQHPLKSVYRKFVSIKTRQSIRYYFNKYIKDVNKKQNLEKINKKYFSKFKI